MYTILDLPQRSEAWRVARAGRLTSSAAAAMLSTIKSGEAAGRRNLRMKLCLERLTGRPQESDYDNDDMERGRDLQPVAEVRYEVETGDLLTPIGFLQHPELLAGASPDGVVMGDDRILGVVEIKCPKAAIHFEALQSKIPAKHLPQLMHLLWITGADYADYVSYNEEFPPAGQFVASRLEAASLDLAGYEKKVRAFLAEVDEELKKVAQYA